MSQREKYAVVLALILVLLIPSALMMKAIYDRDNGTVWQIRIAGFDPRDLLRGHYLRFRYDWNLSDPGASCPPGGMCCLCLNESVPGVRTDPRVTVMTCDGPEARQCSAIIPDRGAGTNGAFMGNQIYFIPQSHASMLERGLMDRDRDFRMEIAVPRGGGAPVIRQILIDGQTMDGFVRANPVAKPVAK